MVNRKYCIEKMKQLTVTMKQLQVELMVLKEYIDRLVTEEEQQMNFSFEGEDDKYSISPQQLMDLLEPYKIR